MVYLFSYPQTLLPIINLFEELNKTPELLTEAIKAVRDDGETLIYKQIKFPNQMTIQAFGM